MNPGRGNRETGSGVTSRIFLSLALSFLGSAVASCEAEDPANRRMRATVEHLSSPDLKGRRVGSAENRRAGDWIATRFSSLGLEPGAEGSYFHEFDASGFEGRNVVGLLPAAQESDEYIVVGAHFDGTGDRDEVHFPAADDNASGIAGMFELVRNVSAHRDELRRNVVFAAFDAEEVGLVGSTAFVDDEIIPSADTRLMVVFDLIGGRFFPWQDKEGIAMGSEHSAYVREVLAELIQGHPTPIRLLGTYVLEPMGPAMARSDYQAYRSAGVPYVFFSTGTPWYYHTKDDSIDRLDFTQAAEITQVACELVLRIATTNDEIDFIPRPPTEVGDLRQLQRILDSILEHREDIALPDDQFTKIERVLAVITDAIAENRGSRILAHQGLQLIFAAAKESKPLKD